MVKAIAAELTGDVDKAIYWYRNEPIADYGHRTAAELVADGQVDAVLTSIRDHENGPRGRRQPTSDPTLQCSRSRNLILDEIRLRRFAVAVALPDCQPAGNIPGRSGNAGVVLDLSTIRS